MQQHDLHLISIRPILRIFIISTGIERIYHSSDQATQAQLLQPRANGGLWTMPQNMNLGEDISSGQDSPLNPLVSQR